MSAAVENGVEASKPRGVFSRAFAKRAQPFEEALTTLNRLNKEGEALALQDDLTTHPTLALMRRILADAQAKFRVMVEENAATGARLDGELERARGECAVLRGELRDVRGALPVVLNNNNGAASNLAAGNSNNNPTGNATASPGQESSNELQQQQSQDDGKRLSAGSSPVDKRSSASDKSASPIEKRSSPVDRKDRSSPIDRRGSPIEKRNGSPSRSPSEKARRAYAPVLEKTRLAGSGGSVDSRSGSASPDRGCGNRSFFHRGGSDRSSVERLRISTNRDSLRSSKEMNDHEKDSDKDLVDGEVRAEEDNEPPGPAPGSRPSSPANSLGIGDPLVASRLSNIHGGGGSTGSVELASTRRLRLENERLVAEVARLRRLLFTGAGRGEVGSEDAALEEEARFVALEMELQHAKEALQALKADRKRLKAEKFDLLNQMKALYGTLEDKERELRDFIRNYEQRMRENEATLGRLQQQGAGIPSEERERERERERWSLLRAARDEADRSLSLAASLADKEAALSHAHATIKELQRQLAERGGGGGICLSDQESLVSFPRGSVNGAATPGAGSSSGGGGCGIIPHMNSQPPLGSTELGVTVGNVGNAAGVGSSGGQAGDRGSCSADSGVRGSSDRESGGATSVGGNLSDSTTDGKKSTPTITVEGSGLDMDSISVVSSIAPSHIYQSATTPKDCSPTLSPLNAFSRSMDNSSLSRSVEQLSSPLESEPRRNKQSTPVAAPAAHSRSSATRGGTWGSISRVFARSRHRKAANNSSGGSGSNEGSDGFDPYRSWSPLTEEGYAEKLRLLREAASVPMERWRAPTVLAWLEVALGMPQYGPRCAENIKSGKVLLELNDQELEAGLGVTHPLHRKKLRLAIEEHRHPSLVRYPCIAQLGHTWVSSEWLPDLGLAQYSESFATNMVDARMLDHLSKKELEKLLGVTRKFHQASIVHGIHLLRMLNYDRQALAIRRHQCEQVDTDPLVWTNQRFIRWARNIDLTEYAENLKDSGVHGALVVLEPSFTGDTMATALGIPPAKHMIRRHLTAELEALVVPARGQLEVVPRNSTAGGRPMSTVSAGGSLGRGSRALHLQHHQSSLSALHMTANHSGTVDRRRSSLRLSWKSSQGSLSRAFGLRPRSEKASPSSSSDTGSLASQYMSSARSNSPPPPQLPPRPITSNKRHRRVKSIGDIDYITSPAVSTPV
uniref:liprin-beta-2 isoform X2 n=1 Tax=Osmia lignaria TaxID=473952 RepID=UPI0014797F8F|nr:liprin-beta-2 isoform X2 [Osmia lignaria]XP_034180884.1 liprin-beta-2 isoform X2 [Osmia lignaria]XP_034180885.1 liprin-beta-2 isoform X2 [Osmia lignaria]XP_034180887.1 liprin-beta-2 isoform X2 [Osmia lignaria]